MNIGNLQEKYEEMILKSIEDVFSKIEKDVHKKVGGSNFEKSFAIFDAEMDSDNPFKMRVFSDDHLLYNCVQYSFDLKKSVEGMLSELSYEKDGAQKARKIRDGFIKLAAMIDKKFPDA